MLNFSIGKQIEKEMDEFRKKRIKLAIVYKDDDTIRYLKQGDNDDGYLFNQGDTINIIDLFYNSKFENGSRDKNRQKKIFLNMGKFRCDVSSKQIEIDVSNFRFIPDDYADPWTATFMQKDFKEWSKDSYFGEFINECVDNFPKYGSLVLKKVDRKICGVPLQTLYNEQTAKNLQVAKYVIEEHKDMSPWEIERMEGKGWNMPDKPFRYDDTITLYERYGYVPLAWLKKHKGEEIREGDENIYVDCMAIVGKLPSHMQETGDGWFVFYCAKVKERPYREAHWVQQHGRWLGIGVMEDLVSNQQAKNIVVNLARRGMQWSAKRFFQSNTEDASAKNLARDVEDGAVLEVGVNGDYREVVMAPKSNADVATFLTEFDKNSDQKAFTYEVATGESLPSGTPFRLGVVLSNSVNSYFAGKREKLGIILKKAVIDFLVPDFIRDMSNEDKVVSMFSGEAGFEVLKKAAMDTVRSEAARITLLTGRPVDVSIIEQFVEPYQQATTLFFKIPKNQYKNAKYKFDLVITGEEIDLEGKIETLKTLAQIWEAKGDPRAEKAYEAIAQLAGENISRFGAPQPRAPQQLNAPQPQQNRTA